MATRGLLLPIAMLHMPSRPAGTQEAAFLDTVPRVRYQEWGEHVFLGRETNFVGQLVLQRVEILQVSSAV